MTERASTVPARAIELPRDEPAWHVEPRRRPLRRGLHEKVVSEIGMRIVSGQLKPFEILVEAELARDFGMSRNGIREAVKVLAAKGLAASRPKVGTRIMPRSDWNMLDPDILWWWSKCPDTADFAVAVTEVRKIVEPRAAALAAQRATKADLAKIRRAYEGMAGNLDRMGLAIEADRDFHEAIMEACGNDILRSVGALIETALIASFNLTVKSSAHALATTLPLHKLVLECIEARDEAGAERAMHRLLDETWVMLAAAVRRQKRLTRQSTPVRSAPGTAA